APVKTALSGPGTASCQLVSELRRSLVGNAVLQPDVAVLEASGGSRGGREVTGGLPPAAIAVSVEAVSIESPPWGRAADSQHIQASFWPPTRTRRRLPAATRPRSPTPANGCPT